MAIFNTNSTHFTTKTTDSGGAVATVTGGYSTVTRCNTTWWYNYYV